MVRSREIDLAKVKKAVERCRTLHWPYFRGCSRCPLLRVVVATVVVFFRLLLLLSFLLLFFR